MKEYAGKKAIKILIDHFKGDLEKKADISHSHSNATQSTDGYMSASDKKKLDALSSGGGSSYTHPSYTPRTGNPSTNQSPEFGGSFTVSQVISDDTGHVTGMNSKNIYIPSTVATTTVPGLMSASDKKKLDNILPVTDTTDGLMTSYYKKQLDDIIASASGGGSGSGGGYGYTHPTYTPFTGDPGNDQTPSFGGTFTVSQFITNTTGHVTTVTPRTIKIPNTVASQTTAGLMSSADKIKLDNIDDRANNYSLPGATSDTRGGVKIGYVQNMQKYPVQLSDEKMFVDIPWTDIKVEQTPTTTNAEFPLLLANANQSSEAIGKSFFDSGVTLNPSTNTIKANITGNAPTATVATKLGSVTVGSTTNPMYLNNGVATASNATVGGPTQPMYMTNGVFTALTESIGSDTSLVYLDGGKIKVSNASVGNDEKTLVLLQNGNLVESTVSVGNGSSIIYLNSGKISESSSSVGASNRPVYLLNGSLTQCDKMLDINITGAATSLTTSNAGDAETPVYFKNGIPVPCTNIAAVWD